jgi:hypothetical protein
LDTNDFIAYQPTSLPFKGGQDEANFLAPRGVFMKNSMLFVSDTGRNRVFIWKKIPSQTTAEPDIVLGQHLTSDTSRNSGGDVSACSLQYPSGIWSDGKKLIVADTWNHRVLIWNQMPQTHGQPADVVIGQPDFESNQPNVNGISQAPTSQSLYWCYGICSDGKSLFIADTGNRRVLYFENIPTENYAKADAVIGQISLEERDYNNENAIWPYSVKISEKGELSITDTQYYRVLLWKNWKDAFLRQADLIVGQPDFDSNGQNQFGLFPDAHTLSWCYDSCFYENGIFIADSGNSRILWFEQTPDSTGSENPETVLTTENTLYWAFSVCIENDLLAIADTGNHRIVFIQLHKP